MDVERVKQGVEVEGFIRTIQEVENRSAFASGDITYTEFTRRINRPYFPREVNSLIGDKLWKDSHFDTGDCTEIDSLPYDNLGDLEDHLKDILGQVFEYCNRKKYLYMLLGVTPISDYGGGHIHCSVQNHKVSYYKELQDMLYPYQPFIALLGQNSHLKRRKGYYVARYTPSSLKDTRLNGRVNFTYKDGYGRSLSIADDLETLEVRYPSASSLYQTMGVATFIKACLFQKDPIRLEQYPDNALERLLNLITRHGSRAPVKLIFNRRVSQILSIGRVFSLMIRSRSFIEGHRRALSELDVSEAEKIRRFFRIFGRGLSMTDYYKVALQRSNVLERCKIIHRIGEQEFFKGESFIESIKLRKRNGALPRFYNGPFYIPEVPAALFHLEEGI